MTRAVPYAALGGRLFYPADAAVEPPVSADDLAAGLRFDVQVLHPTAGLVGFAAGDAIGVHELLAPPPRRAADWSRAEVGPPPLPALVSVEAEALPPSIADVLGMGQDDIGADADDGDDPQLSLFGKVKGLFGQPQSPKSVAARQGRELRRLLALLKSDPDAGLRRALPMRDIATRGAAPASGSLSNRIVDFNLRKLSGGASRGSPWAVENEMRRRLTAEYREAANRELDLGRHRRAAYIFAHLLGDFAAAAAALAKGRFYREAAAVHRDHLNNKRAAADCLAAGGLLGEAIPIYLELSQYELAGDLHARLGQADDALGCYRRAADQYQSRGDPVGAARLLEAKAADPDAALALLAATWPTSDKAAVCLHEWFAMAGRLGRHEEAGRRAAMLRDGDVPWYRAAALAETLSAVARTFPNGPVRDRAADGARAVAGRRLAAADSAERESLVRAVVALVPGDHLLSRDGSRFLERRPAKRMAAVAKSEPPAVRTFRLPPPFMWRSVVSSPGGFLALGVTAGACVVVRSAWAGVVTFAEFDRDVRADGGYALLPSDAKFRVMVVPTARRARASIEWATLAGSDEMPAVLSVGSPPYATGDAAGACRHENGTTWLVYATDADVTLAAYAADDSVLLTRQLPGVSADELSPAPVPIVARRSDVYLAAQRQLVRLSGPARVSRIDLPGEVRSLVASPPHTAVRVLATFEEGCALVREDDCQPFGRQLVRPAATFTPDGSVVAVSRGVAHEYRPAGAGLAFVRAFDVPTGEVVAVLPVDGGRVGAVDVDGGVHVFRYTAR